MSGRHSPDFDSGGSRPAITLTRSSAVFDAARTYRYSLVREWDPDRGRCAFVLLNPSTAGEVEDDATLRRCLGFARGWGLGAVEIVNLFGYRAVEPKDMFAAADPIGPDNDRHLESAVAAADLVIAAWGNWGRYRGRGEAVRGRLVHRAPRCFGLTRELEPRHPLYLPRGCALQPLDRVSPSR